MDDKWRDFDNGIFERKTAFDVGQLHKKLGAILESLKKSENVDKMFENVDKKDMKSGSMSTINMQFNTKTNEVKVFTQATD